MIQNSRIELIKNGVSTGTRRHVIVAYHAHCIDGFTSAWVAARALQDEGRVVELFPMSYNEESYAKLSRKINGKVQQLSDLYIVDFSVSFKWLVLYKRNCSRVVVVDHHKTAFENYGWEGELRSDSYMNTSPMQGVHIFLDNAESGASLTARHFHGDYIDRGLCRLVRYVKDYDLWLFKNMYTKIVNAYIRTLEFDLAIWDRLAEHLDSPLDASKIVAAGKELLAKHEEDCQEYAKNSSPIYLEHIAGRFCFCPPTHVSRVGHILCEQYPEAYFTAMCCTLNEEGEEKEGDITWSLRSEGTNDCSNIARAKGGGGHKNAAGFALTLQETQSIIATIRPLESIKRRD